MATGSVQVTAGSGTPIRIVTNAGVDAGADQQVMTLADSAGNLLGTIGAPLPVQLTAGTNTVGSTTGSALNVTGTIAAGSAAVDGTSDLGAYSSVRVSISGSWVGTLAFQSSVDGSNWTWHNLNTHGSTPINSTTANIAVFGEVGGRYFRVWASVWTSGTATVTLQYSSLPSPIQSTSVYVNVNAGSNTIGNVGLASGTSTVGQLLPSTLVVTATGAAAAATATLPAAGAGLFHYITAVRFERFITAATTAAATLVVTGGANHGLIFNLPNDAATLGTQSVPVDYRPTAPLRVTAANTATTFTAPAVTGTQYRITVTYYTGT